MRIIFMGSADVSCVSLQALLNAGHFELAGVVTQPDRPKGRQLEPTPCPVKAMVLSSGITILSPANVNDPVVLSELAALEPDLVVVVAYGQILRRPVLSLARLGCINMHASLLPKYRGAAPAQWAIANGDTVTGISVMHLNERMDAGDVILQREQSIRPDDTAGTLLEKLAALGGAALVDAMDALQSGTSRRIVQDEKAATYARKLTRDDARIDWTMPASAIHNRVRGFSPWPGATCLVPRASGRQIKVLRTTVETAAGSPGTVLDITGEGPLVAAGTGSIRLLEIQPVGKTTMSGRAFLCGTPLTTSDVVG